MSDQRMIDRFVRLCETPSPTGAERAVADDVLGELRELGVEVREDDAAEPARAGAGNLIAPVPGRGRRVGLVLRPPRHGARARRDRGRARRRRVSQPRRDDPRRRQQGGRRRAGRARRAPRRARRRPGWSSCSRSPRRTACAGAKELDLGALRSPFGYVLDHASPIGEVITAAPTYQRLVAEFEGLEAHAGIRPEDGHSAIEAAAAAIGAMQLGRLDPETTANVGVIARRRRLERRRRATAGSRARRARSTRQRSPRRPRRCSTRAPGRRASTAATSTSTSPRSSAATASRRAAPPVAARARGARALRDRAARGRDRRRQRRERAVARGFDCVLLANGTEANHTPSGERRRGAARPRCSPSARRSPSSPGRPRSERVDAEAAPRHRRRGRPADRRGRRRASRRPGPTRRWSGEVEVGDEVVVNTAGARPRARLGRLRHRPRQPQPRPDGGGDARAST